ncbi:hypothetical protein GCM10023093_25740 [Nemorincola caseinilytica]|uniref:Uncharacterized protein n=1 Tax=Nemorincola caseinilytica TaxID=2054315 RepID=A0ABP8NMJ0_9BACT
MSPSVGSEKRTKVKSKKVAKIASINEQDANEKISLEVMRNIWDDEQTQHTELQLTRMREFAYLIMQAVVKIVKNRKSNSRSYEAKESNTIHPGEYRRAS